MLHPTQKYLEHKKETVNAFRYFGFSSFDFLSERVAEYFLRPTYSYENLQSMVTIKLRNINSWQKRQLNKIKLKNEKQSIL